MPLEQRQEVMREIEKIRDGRRLVALCNFDRVESPNLGALATQFKEDIKESLYRVLKETLKRDEKLDLFLYTRGGDVNAVWPIASLLREFDSDFEVLVPFRAHSAGTLLMLAGKKVVMTPIAELSPIDPTTANQFNPRDPTNPKAVLGIGVEDVSAYREFWEAVLEVSNEEMPTEKKSALLQPYLSNLASNLHPLALGGVHRMHQQIRMLATMLLKRHYGTGKKIQSIIIKLTTEYYSHQHMIHRDEAKKILGAEHVTFSSTELSEILDTLLRNYEDDFELRHPFFLAHYLGDDVEKEARFIGGCVESTEWSYLFETRMKVRQHIVPPDNVQIQVQPGQPVPLVPGLPRGQEWQPMAQGWIRNVQPIGVTT